jgi:hypothetical protein
MRIPPVFFMPSAAVMITLSLAIVGCGEDEVDTGDPPADTGGSDTVPSQDLLGTETSWTLQQTEFSSDCSIGVYGVLEIDATLRGGSDAVFDMDGTVVAYSMNDGMVETFEILLRCMLDGVDFVCDEEIFEESTSGSGDNRIELSGTFDETYTTATAAAINAIWVSGEIYCTTETTLEGAAG